MMNLSMARSTHRSTCSVIMTMATARLLPATNRTARAFLLSPASKSYADAVEALIVLGYARKQAEQLIEKIQIEITPEDTVETILKKVFKFNREC